MGEKIDVIYEKGVYRLLKPRFHDDQNPLILDSPHSGRIIPPSFNPLCSVEDLEKSEDRYVDDLFSDAPELGASLLLAEFPRVYIDLNRHESDIHPRQLSGDTSMIKDLDIRPSVKANAGIGLVHETLNDGQEISATPLDILDLEARLSTYYRPYHQALKDEIHHLGQSFGKVLHLNCHSMPRFTSPKIGQDSIFSKVQNKKQRADIVIGTLDRHSCSDEWSDIVYKQLKDIGFSVMLNKPFKGAEIVRRYGCPTQNIHSIQIEINRALYLDQNEHYKSESFDALKEALTQFTRRLVQALS